jgi:zinc protease
MRVLGGLLLCAVLSAQQGEVKSHVLSNGMKVLIQEDQNIPNVAMYFFYKIGARNERPGITGISHFFEHMMFNGAAKYGPKQFDNEMEKAGGNNNAYTSEDVTVYTDWFPDTALELMFDMEADRMRNLAFDPKLVESERGVVYSERRTSVDNSNTGLLHEQLRAAVFTAHPYHWPVVGWPSDIEGWTMDDLKAHYKMGYAPNNCVMVVVGAVTEARVMELVKKYIEPIPSQAPPPEVRTKEPEQIGERRVTIRKQAQLAVQLVGFHAPDAKNPDMTVLEVIDALLTAGQSSRLYTRMVDRDQIALNVGAQAERSLDPGMFMFQVTPRAGVDPAKTEAVLFEEIGKLRSETVSAEELQKAKNQLLKQHYSQLKTIAGRANLLGTFEVFHGDYKKLFTSPQEIEAVTPAEVQRVAAKYFEDKGRTVVTLIPATSSTQEVKQ